MKYKNITFKHENGIGIITIDRPDKMNALNNETLNELNEVLDKVKKDHTHVLIITGKGGKAFVAGADIEELHEQNKQSGYEFALFGQSIFSKIENLGKPVIAAVNGYALGGGCELALACHIRIASQNAKFGQPEVKLGIIPGYGGTQRLPRIIGIAKAIEYSLTGDIIDAVTAEKLGLVNKVVESDELMVEAKSMAGKIASFGQVAVSKILNAILLSPVLTIEEGLKREAAYFADCCGTADFVEGTEAFLNKRIPKFQNK